MNVRKGRDRKSRVSNHINSHHNIHRTPNSNTGSCLKQTITTCTQVQTSGATITGLLHEGSQPCGNKSYLQGNGGGTEEPRHTNV